MVNELTWQDWRSGGEELIALRDLAPGATEEQLAAAWRLLENAGDDPIKRGPVLELLAGCQAARKEE